MALAIKQCRRCKMAFLRPENVSNGQWGNRTYCSKRCAAQKSDFPHDRIVALYVSGKSSPEISEIAGLSATHIRRILKDNHVTIRTGKDAMEISHARPSTKAKLAAASAGRKHTEDAKDKLRCRTGSMNAQWRNGITITAGGYLKFTSSPANGEHMGKFLHTVVAEWSVGRPLKEGEVVHHKDRNKTNNSPENLQVMTASEHALLHIEAGEFIRKSANA